jgi:hypothetical protein
MKIDLRKYFCTGKLIEKNIDAGQQILVLDRDGIQKPVVNITFLFYCPYY